MKDINVFLNHILECIDKIESFTKGYTLSVFLKDEMVQSAVIRQIEIIGEAVKNLPKSFINKYPNIPWSDIAGTRDKLIHNYFGVDLELVYDIVVNELPKLKEGIKLILKQSW